MKHGLELTTRLSTDSKFKSLYSWSLQEYDADGGKVGSDVIPWTCSFYFQATQIERVHALQSVSYPEGKPVSERDCLRCNLVSIRGEFDRPVQFSIFGTRRPIHDLKLEVVRLQDLQAEELCEVYAIPEFVYEPEFPTIPSETHPDALAFVVYLAPDKFERLLATLESDTHTQLGLMVRGVSGFYAGWSPDIVTSHVKVLPAGKDFKPEAPDGCTVEAPSTGRVREFGVTAQRVVRSKPQAHDEVGADQCEEVAAVQPLSRPEVMQIGSILKQLNQIKIAVWGVGIVLFLIWVSSH